MKETNELLEHIYKDASMGSYTMEHLLEELKERDNKIKGLAEDILKEYQEFKSKAKEQLKKENIKLEEDGLIAKMMSTMGISKEVKKDNSVAAIADMFIKGVSMGSIEMEKKIKDFSSESGEKEYGTEKKSKQYSLHI